jgi:PII-like signaling protein
MTETVQRKRIEVLVDGPLVKSIIRAAEESGIKGYTLLPTLGGAGAGGRWSEDQVSGAQSKVIFLTITSEAKCEALTDRLAPILESHGLMLFISPVDVIRAEKF